MKHKNLYHIDAKGKTRVWSVEQVEHAYRTHAGILDGKLVISDWKEVSGKSMGRSNETSPREQASLEIAAMYERRMERKYTPVLEEASRSFIFEVMTAKTYDPKKKMPDMSWFGQPKFDGLRCIMKDDGGFSRAGKPFFTVDHIFSEAQEVLEKYNVYLDGELYNHEYHDDFNKITSLIKQTKFDKLSQEEKDEIVDKVEMHVYDIFVIDQPDMIYSDRKAFLEQIFSNHTFEKIILSETIELPKKEDIQPAHDQYVQMNYEGIMLRDPNSVYEHKRSKGLWKYKNFKEEEFRVVSIDEGVGNWKGAAKTATLLMPNGELSSAGITGSYEKNKEIFENKEKFIGGDATTKFQDFTPDGKLRFGVIKKFYEGRRDD